MALTKTFTLINETGLHARPAAMFVKIASRFNSDIWVVKDDEEADGKSIMGLMMLAAEKGSQLEISIEGDDAEAAMKEIENLINSAFQEK